MQRLYKRAKVDMLKARSVIRCRRKGNDTPAAHPSKSSTLPALYMSSRVSPALLAAGSLASGLSFFDVASCCVAFLVVASSFYYHDETAVLKKSHVVSILCNILSPPINKASGSSIAFVANTYLDRDRQALSAVHELLAQPESFGNLLRSHRSCQFVRVQLLEVNKKRNRENTLRGELMNWPITKSL